MNNIDKTINDINNFYSDDPLEMLDKKTIIKFIKDHLDDVLLRDNQIAHLTASAIIVNENKTKVLFAYHLIYQTFAWLGGHVDGETDLYKVALKEIQEESGLKRVKPITDQIISLEILPVMNHIKNGKLVPNHLHLNVTYAFIGYEADAIHIKEDENSAVKWINIEDLNEAVKEQSMLVIYNKIINRIKNIKENK